MGASLPRPAGGVVLAAAARPRCRLRRRFFGRNDRQQQVGLPVAAEMQAGDAAEDTRGPVAGVVVQEWPAARELVDECTSTIVGEVESLKGLVDEFAHFARMPAPKAVLPPM